MIVSVLASLILSASGPAAAAPVESPPVTVTGRKKHWDPNRTVCKDLDQPGSRLNRVRVCRTALEWAEALRADQQLLLLKQYNGAP